MSLRDSLYAPSDTWIEEIDEVIEELPASLLNEWDALSVVLQARPSATPNPALHELAVVYVAARK